jgi:proteasome lid subunit RPN8/RPN11
MTFYIPRAILAEIELQARLAVPLECCGLLGGRDFRALSCHPMRNRASRPEAEFFAAPEDLFEAMRELRQAGEEIVGIYHSHPRGPAEPSETDIRMAYYPSVAQIIIVPGDPSLVRSFLIDNTRVRSIAIEEVD